MPDRDGPRRTAELVRRRYGDRPVRVATALADGLTESQLRAAVRAGLLARVRHGYLMAAGTGAGADDPMQALAARARATTEGSGPDCVVRDEAAAALLGLPSAVPGRRLPRALPVYVPTTGWRTREVRARAGRVAPEDRVEVRGVLCTSPARTALDLARGRPLAESLVLLDAALRAVVLADPLGSGTPWRRAADPAATARARVGLRDAYDRLRPARHARALRRAVELADPRAETPLESASRGVLLQGGVPAPDLQVWVQGDDGQWYRCDMGWRDSRVLGEADGRVKYGDGAAVWAEKRRQEAILGAGEWRTMVRWTAEEVWRHPDRLLTRVTRALGR